MMIIKFWMQFVFMNLATRYFYCFTAYDKLLKKKVKFNNNTRYGAISYRNELLYNHKDRYSRISDIFTDTLDI